MSDLALAQLSLHEIEDKCQLSEDCVVTAWQLYVGEVDDDFSAGDFSADDFSTCDGGTLGLGSRHAHLLIGGAPCGSSWPSIPPVDLGLTWAAPETWCHLPAHEPEDQQLATDILLAQEPGDADAEDGEAPEETIAVPSRPRSYGDSEATPKDLAGPLGDLGPRETAGESGHRRAWHHRSVSKVARFVVGAGLLVIVLALAAGTIPRLFGYHSLLIQTGSMGTAAPRGSLVVARWTSPTAVRVGTIVLLRRPEQADAVPVLHRVIERRVEPGGVVVRTKGDANASADPGSRILPERVLTPVWVLPLVGYLVAASATQAGWFALIVLPASVLLAGLLVRTWARPVVPAAI